MTDPRPFAQLIQNAEPDDHAYQAAFAQTVKAVYDAINETDESDYDLTRAEAKEILEGDVSDFAQRRQSE